MHSDEVPSWREVILRGHRTFPTVPWAASSRWRAKPLTFAVLLLGLSLFGIGEGLLVVTGIGNSPWVVLSQGISGRTGLSIGWVTFLVSVCVLSLWWPLRERPGFGTIANIVVIAVVLEAVVLWLPPITNLALAVVVDVLAVFLVGLASALYITTQLGPGPRDGLMTALHHRTGLRVSQVRLALESSVLCAGWLLGGTAGIGTLLFAGLIGRAIAFWLGVLARAVHQRPLPESGQ